MNNHDGMGPRFGGNNAKKILSCAPTAKGINKLIKN